MSTAAPLASTQSFDGQRSTTFVIIVDETRSWRHPLDNDGTWTIGRAEDCALRLDDLAASRRHAELCVRDGVASLRDLGSHNGTAVNGELLGTAERTLVPGDVITICATTLAFHTPAPRRRNAPALDTTTFHEQLALELDRALSAGRRLSVLAIEVPATKVDAARLAVRTVLRPMDVTTNDGPTRMLVLLPEVDADELAVRATGVRDVITHARIGGATAPDDALDGGALLAAAREGAIAARPDEYVASGRTTRQLELGEHRVILAEPAMHRIYALLAKVAPSTVPVLVLGETGVGKESVVAALHFLSPRREAPLVAVNCAALPETLAESTLFGHERGAFSGALAAQPGRLEAAAGGTLFLDEIGELSLAIQAKLLRALDGRSFTRLGSTLERRVDVRVVAATNRDLRAEIAVGRFREDLYYRLAGTLVHVPPLRERPRDVPVLARELLEQACTQLGRPIAELGVAALDALARHPWPGNVRELRNAMSFAASALDLADAGVVEVWHLPTEIADHTNTSQPLEPSPTDTSTASTVSAPSRFRPIAEELRELERRRMIQALTVTGGVQLRAAELLRMPRRTFVTRMREYNLHALFPRSL